MENRIEDFPTQCSFERADDNSCRFQSAHPDQIQVGVLNGKRHLDSLGICLHRLKPVKSSRFSSAMAGAEHRREMLVDYAPREPLPR